MNISDDKCIWSYRLNFPKSFTIRWMIILYVHIPPNCCRGVATLQTNKQSTKQITLIHKFQRIFWLMNAIYNVNLCNQRSVRHSTESVHIFLLATQMQTDIQLISQNQRTIKRRLRCCWDFHCLHQPTDRTHSCGGRQPLRASLVFPLRTSPQEWCFHRCAIKVSEGVKCIYSLHAPLASYSLNFAQHF